MEPNGCLWSLGTVNVPFLFGEPGQSGPRMRHSEPRGFQIRVPENLSPVRSLGAATGRQPLRAKTTAAFSG
jgi:hypothetical protein